MEGLPVMVTASGAGAGRSWPAVRHSGGPRRCCMPRHRAGPLADAGLALPTDRAKLQTRNGVMSIIPLLAQSAFEPETIESLVSVFEDAWQKVEQSGSKLASPAYKRAAQEILAKRIIDTAQRGEFDPHQLANDAVEF